MNLKYNNLHFIGVGGIGVSALARLAKLSGKKVSGSDMRKSIVTESLQDMGCRIYIGHDKNNIPRDTDLVVHTEDVNESSAGFVELQSARDQKITTMKYSQALGMFIEGSKGIGVSGTNGKSTTTAILGFIMEAAGTDPMVVLGSRMAPQNESKQFKGNARFGAGEYFVYEADEYHRHMLDSKPFAAIITNIEEDHLDYFKNLQNIKNAFSEFVVSLPAEGLLVYNFDDANTATISAQAKARTVSFSLNNPKADYFSGQIETKNQSQVFHVHKNNKQGKAEDLGEFQLKIPGDYNVMNAIGAIVMALELGVKPEVAQKALSEFAGIWRRFETVGKLGDSVVVSDYAHHPTAVTGLITAAKQFYPNTKILLVFQPHQKNRTKMLFNEFVASLKDVDQIILPEIYFVPGREKDEDKNISSKDLVAKIVNNGQPCLYASDLDEAEKNIRAIAKDFGLILCVGAGTIDALARKLIL